MTEHHGRGSARTILTGACTLAALSALAGASGAHAATTILPLGDSITEGTAIHAFSGDDYPESAYRNEPDGAPANLGSYREHLHDLLTHPSCDADIEWVGARRANGRVPATHEGHGGWHAAYFRQITWRDANGVHEGERDLPGWLPAFDPDIVTLHVGTNGLGRARSASQNADDIEGILDAVFEHDAGTRVLLANLVPIAGWWGDRATNLPDSRPTVREEAQVLTGLIGNLAAEQRAAGRDVVLVDVNSEFYLDESNPVDCPAATGGDPNNMAMTVCVPHPDGEGTIPDGLHPGLRGERFMAERFFAAMRSSGDVCEVGGGSAPEPITPPEPVAPVTPTEPSPTEPEGSPGTDNALPETGPGVVPPEPIGPTDPGGLVPVDENGPSTGEELSDAMRREVEELIRLLGSWRHGRGAR